MGMFYCHTCDRHHDSKDGEYNVDNEGREHCDSVLVVPLHREINTDELQRRTREWMKRNFIHGLLATEKQMETAKPLELKELS